MSIRSTRSSLYRAARFLGDVEAAEHGPSAYGKRLVRKRVLRRTNGVTMRVLRALMK